MRSTLYLALLLLALMACQPAIRPTTVATDSLHAETLNGTYKLLSALIITKGDTQQTFPVANQEMVKLFNGTHFAFLKHDLTQGQGNNPVFEAGEGTFTLHNHHYTEHLVYCNYRAWENQDFSFTLTQQGDTLIQKGIEKIDSLQVDHEIVETYLKQP
ncbi:hypothetical protein GA0116948_104208 [Chitinophaga costaii]|uniref:Lipocalin-like domain-containing protein n=1 Tax=Chitinophaga costaii TaxID=1335309 RepID=A0A1C4CMX7_9BACT|nr:hypothetical protein [Chitinophaga costaii]PUZ27024.1 hypothetical protein DCM91_07255 [Chitinophaga costaii]SCC20455.1 hypothetical protein GA0116948_104208 [Chitinophaga costaii]